MTDTAMKETIVSILKRHHITRAALFGSYARGEETPESDVDILIEPPEKMSLLGVIGLEQEMEDTLGKSVDVVTFRSLSPYIKKYVEKDALPLL